MKCDGIRAGAGGLPLPEVSALFFNGGTHVDSRFPQGFWTTLQAARRFSTTEDAILALVREGSIVTVTVGGKLFISPIGIEGVRRAIGGRREHHGRAAP